MSDKWSFRIDIYNGVSVFKEGTLYSGCGARINNFNENAKKSIKFLCDLGKEEENEAELSDMIYTAILALMDRFD